MIDNWEKEIAKALEVQNETERLDTEFPKDYYPPNAPATEEELALAHSHLGFPIDPHYKRFLSHANGWRSIYIEVDLFGTEELRGGPLMQAALDVHEYLFEYLEEYIEEHIRDWFPNGGKITKSDLLPIGFSRVGRDMFFLLKPESAAPGMVIWAGDSDYSRYSNFDDFFQDILHYNKEILHADQKAQRDRIERADGADAPHPAQAERRELPNKAGGVWRSLLGSLFRGKQS